MAREFPARDGRASGSWDPLIGAARSCRSKLETRARRVDDPAAAASNRRREWRLERAIGYTKGMVKILAFAGSLRRDSFNKKAVRIAAEGARSAGAQVDVIDLRDYDMPLYDGDLERDHGMPEGARRFREELKAHDALLVASPEYNSSISAVLKNAIDWATRTEKGGASLECFQGKVAGLVAASPGALGGLRGLVTLRSLLGNIGVIVIPEQATVAKAHEMIAADGGIADAKVRESLEKVGLRVAKVAASFSVAR